MNFVRKIKWGKALYKLRKGEKTTFESKQITYHVATSQTRFESEKANFTTFPPFRKGTSGARKENLRPVLKPGLWRCNMLSNLLTLGHRKVVFSLFLILYRAFSQVRKPHVLPISQEENGPIMIPKIVLKSNFIMMMSMMMILIIIIIICCHLSPLLIAN